MYIDPHPVSIHIFAMPLSLPLSPILPSVVPPSSPRLTVSLEADELVDGHTGLESGRRISAHLEME